MSLIAPPAFLQSLTFSKDYRGYVRSTQDVGVAHANGEDPNMPAKHRNTIYEPMLGEAAATAFQSVNIA